MGSLVCRNYSQIVEIVKLWNYSQIRLISLITLKGYKK